jgi:dihydroorotate dehydrogenase electron transfer subunit
MPEKISDIMPPGRSFTAKVESNTRLNKDHYILTFTPPSETLAPRPGQFYMVGVGSPIEPLLKRPFCYLSKTREGIQLLYRVRGKGTELLKEARAGTDIDMLGPLGRPYPMPKRGSSSLVVTGGVAVASVFPLIGKLRGRARVVLGARSRDELLLLEEIGSIAGELHASTEDGSYGKRGTVIDVLKELRLNEETVLYICGPKGMARAVTEFALDRGITKGYVSLEEFMACGIGACMGCVVKTVKGYSRVCKEGPVFRINEIKLNGMEAGQ